MSLAGQDFTATSLAFPADLFQPARGLRLRSFRPTVLPQFAELRPAALPGLPLVLSCGAVHTDSSWTSFPHKIAKNWVPGLLKKSLRRPDVTSVAKATVDVAALT